MPAMERSQKPRKKLGNLPASGSSYFTKYKADTYQVELKKPKPCKHQFVYRKAQEIVCEKCKMGLFLSLGDYLKDGHLYREDKLIL